MLLRRAYHLALNEHIVPRMLKVTPIPLLADNYCWRVASLVARTAVLVDPADGAKALAAHKQAEAEDGCELVGVLSTHYHGDHTGGNEWLAENVAGLTIVGGAEEGDRVPAANKHVKDGDMLELPGFSFKALHTPCHTRGHICYHTTAEVQLGPMLTGGEAPPAGTVPPVPAPGLYPGAVFTGDTLFSAGCGRFFEGDAPQMLASLSRLASLPPRTLVYCGHEYTVANLRFGLAVEPGNTAMTTRLAACEALRAQGRPTIPSTLEQEAETNVFLRTARPEYRALPILAAAHTAGSTTGSTGAHPASEVEVMAALRAAKNGFKG